MPRNKGESRLPITGIYQIVCIPNNFRYIGSSRDIHFRWITHKRDLRSNRHHNSMLQTLWMGHDEQTFVLQVVKELPGDISRNCLRDEESDYIAQAIQETPGQICNTAIIREGAMCQPRYIGIPLTDDEFKRLTEVSMEHNMTPRHFVKSLLCVALNQQGGQDDR